MIYVVYICLLILCAKLQFGEGDRVMLPTCPVPDSCWASFHNVGHYTWLRLHTTERSWWQPGNIFSVISWKISDFVSNTFTRYLIIIPFCPHIMKFSWCHAPSAMTLILLFFLLFNCTFSRKWDSFLIGILECPKASIITGYAVQWFCYLLHLIRYMLLKQSSLILMMIQFYK